MGAYKHTLAYSDAIRCSVTALLSLMYLCCFRLGDDVLPAAVRGGPESVHTRHLASGGTARKNTRILAHVFGQDYNVTIVKARSSSKLSF